MGARGLSPCRPALEHDPRGGADPPGWVRDLEALQLRYAGLCEITIRDGTWYAERNGCKASGNTPGALAQAILITWGGR